MAAAAPRAGGSSGGGRQQRRGRRGERAGGRTGGGAAAGRSAARHGDGGRRDPSRGAAAPFATRGGGTAGSRRALTCFRVCFAAWCPGNPTGRLRGSPLGPPPHHGAARGVRCGGIASLATVRATSARRFRDRGGSRLTPAPLFLHLCLGWRRTALVVLRSVPLLNRTRCGHSGAAPQTQAATAAATSTSLPPPVDRVGGSQPRLRPPPLPAASQPRGGSTPP